MRDGRDRLHDRLLGIEYSRGFAALMVMWFHFTYVLPAGWLRMSGLYGYLGVEVFFVISGFIIPYALDARDYRIGRDGLAFIGRRVVRLEPPYLASVLLILGVPFLAGLTPWFDGTITAHDLYRAELHLLYLVPWFGEDWFSAVYWSLAIEFQYYFFVLFAAPLLLYRDNLWPQRAFLLAVIAASLPGGDERLLPMYLPVFGFGFLQFLAMRRGMALRECVLWAAALAAATFVHDGTWVIGVAIALVALNMPWPRAALLFYLGTISYSLYLLHGAVGYAVGELAARFLPLPPVTELAVQIAATLILATVFWLLVERPSTQLSQKIGRKADGRSRGRAASARSAPREPAAGDVAAVAPTQ